MNVLSYSSLSPFTCNEKLHITPGATCFSEKILKKLHKLETELNVDSIELIPITNDQESLPTDGSDKSNMIRRLAAILDCGSEYCILGRDGVKKILTEDEIKLEKRRFKVKGPRDTDVGTDGELHAYRVLLQWSEVFDFFYPLPHIIISKTVGSKDVLSAAGILKIVKNQYPTVRVISADISIEIETKEGSGFHSVAVLIDLRENVWTVEFFDSSGYPPNEYVSNLLEDIASRLREHKKKLNERGRVETVIVSGRVKHQCTASECGLHSLIYIRRRLEGLGYQFFSRFKIPDDYAKEMRRMVFVSG